MMDMEVSIRLVPARESLVVIANGCHAEFPVREIYTAIKHQLAREDIEAYLSNEKFSEEAIREIVTDDFVRQWENTVGNNECIAECKELAAIDLAAEKGYRWYGKPQFAAGDMVIFCFNHECYDTPVYHEHNGMEAEILELVKDGQGHDRYEVGYMYEVRFADGISLRAFQSELRLSKQQKPNVEGICPVCGNHIAYGSFELQDEGGVYDWSCLCCGASGKEGYDLVFDSHYDVRTKAGDKVELFDASSFCPVCGAEYSVTDVLEDGYDSGTYVWKCPNCGISGRQDYTIHRKESSQLYALEDSAGNPVKG